MEKKSEAKEIFRKVLFLSLSRARDHTKMSVAVDIVKAEEEEKSLMKYRRLHKSRLYDPRHDK